MRTHSLATSLTALLTAAVLAACTQGEDTGRTDAPGASLTAEDSRQEDATSRGSTAEDGRTADAGSARVAGVRGRRVEVVAVGDMVCKPGAEPTPQTCQHAATAELTKQIDPDAVLGLGDLQYEVGSLSAFRNQYDKSWGDLKGITYPTPGNHEYKTEGAAGYYEYFSDRQPGPPGYYAVDLGRWRAYLVNGNCEYISCARQARWLKRDLRNNPRTCSLIASHHPRWSTGTHGNEATMRRFFRIALNNRVDLMLGGHDHHYERFKRMNNDGDVVKRGVMQFVSGAGGKVHYSADGDMRGSAYVDDTTYGVLRLALRPDSFRFGFRGIDGSSEDNGTRECI